MPKRRPPVQKTTPEDLSSILERVLTKNDAYSAFKKVRLLNECKKRIGEDFAQHLKPERIHNGVLYCIVDSPSWLQQYQFCIPEILKRINTPPLEEAVTGLRFTVGKTDESEYLYDAGDPVTK